MNNTYLRAIKQIRFFYNSILVITAFLAVAFIAPLVASLQNGNILPHTAAFIITFSATLFLPVYFLITDDVKNHWKYTGFTLFVVTSLCLYIFIILDKNMFAGIFSIYAPLTFIINLAISTIGKLAEKVHSELDFVLDKLSILGSKDPKHTILFSNENAEHYKSIMKMIEKKKGKECSYGMEFYNTLGELIELMNKGQFDVNDSNKNVLKVRGMKMDFTDDEVRALKEHFSL